MRARSLPLAWGGDLGVGIIVHRLIQCYHKLIVPQKGTFVRTNVPHLIEKMCYTGQESVVVNLGRGA
jgi:hypothetical protein